MPARRAASGRAPAASRAQIGDGGDGDARGLQIESRLIGFIAGGDDDRTGPDPHSIAIQISLRGARQ